MPSPVLDGGGPLKQMCWPAQAEVYWTEGRAHILVIKPCEIKLRDRVAPKRKCCFPLMKGKGLRKRVAGF